MYNIFLLLFLFIPSLLCATITPPIPKSATDLISYRDPITGVINIDSIEKYNLLLNNTNISPEYYTALLITKENNNENICLNCQIFENEVYNPVNKILNLYGYNSQVIFMKISSDSFTNSENYQIFHYDLENKIKTVPKLFIFPPFLVPNNDTEIVMAGFDYKKNNFYEFPIPNTILDSKSVKISLTDYIAKILQVFIEIPLDEREQVSSFMVIFVTCLSIFVFFKKKIYPHVKSFIFRFIAMLASFLIIYGSITGYKFTVINKIPFIARNSDTGEIMWYSGGFSWQFGIEIFEVSGMYILMGLLVLTLIIFPKFYTNSNKKTNSSGPSTLLLLLVLLGTIIVCMALTLLMIYFNSCFKIKYPSYPF
ncbi:uncharacterized protein SCODWIG_02133 [Saccharomycodes ludwigii]|uniref:Dolichyl-diphosphooligosaccharide--protein glycosyltransferase subunit OST6 n=1 Tax=Saccharomycodes ludwigii TaxID=36035 RepID=A0A376B6U6_9ASCO|nr:uncharacterized protein SCODWIG_02133 [Saccharomycodes ludwigii]